MKEPGRDHQLLIIRLSAMGDVVLVVPVIRSLLKENPHLSLALVTNRHFTPFFYGIERLRIIPADINGKHKGFGGLFKLFWKIRSYGKYHAVIDLHGVLRSYVVSLLFRITGNKVFRIRKGRNNKRKIVRGGEFTNLRHTTDRYSNVFVRALPELKQSEAGIFHILKNPASIPPVDQFISELDIKAGTTKIGLAPMAKHKLKMWPVEKLIQLIKALEHRFNVVLILFGGPEDKPVLEKLASQSESVKMIPSSFSLSEEIELISRMDLMLAMDSGNMHIAALVNVPTFSIWGGTHPGLGFSAMYQPRAYQIQIPREDLNCRPCTVYGKGHCARGDLACLEWIGPEEIIKRITEQGFLE